MSVPVEPICKCKHFEASCSLTQVISIGNGILNAGDIVRIICHFDYYFLYTEIGTLQCLI